MMFRGIIERQRGQKMLDSYDTNLKFIRNLGSRFSSEYAVMQVELDGKHYIFKKRTHHDDAIRQIKKEIGALDIAREQDIPYVTLIEKIYDNNAILKEFFSGRPLDKITSDFYINPKIALNLEYSARLFHAHMITGLDIRKRNIVVSHDGINGMFIDLDFSYIHREENRAFHIQKNQEFSDLDNVFDGLCKK